jgi:hypothetical protein
MNDIVALLPVDGLMFPVLGVLVGLCLLVLLGRVRRVRWSVRRWWRR